MPRLTVTDLGDYLREQREAAQLSLRQLSELAGVSNPYLSQIERGLRRPSAEILNALAKGLEISSESLYVRAGLLEDGATVEPPRSGREQVVHALESDPALSARQRRTLIDLYDQMTDHPERGHRSHARTTPPTATPTTSPARRAAASRRRTSSQTTRSTS